MGYIMSFKLSWVVVQFLQFFREGNYNFQGSLHQLQIAGSRKLDVVDFYLFIHCMLLDTFSPANPLLAAGNPVADMAGAKH